MRRDVGKLSYSQISLYKRCPRLWYEQYIEGHRLKEVSQPLSFGIAYHAGVEELMSRWGDDIAVSEACSRFEWEYCFGRMPGPNEKKWMPIGNRLIVNLVDKLWALDFEPIAIEKMVERNKFRGRIDCVADVKGEKTIIDWKTANRPYDLGRVDIDEQLTAYSYLLPDVPHQGFCVGVKDTQEIFWYETVRTSKQRDDFEDMVRHIRREMEEADKFPGMHTREACMMWGRECDMMKLGICDGTNDF